MILSRLWLIRKVCFIVLLLMTDIIFDYGITSCSSFQLSHKGNQSLETGNRGAHHVFLNNYFYSVLNKTRALEETIYSDLVNNLRSLVKTERNKIPDPSGKLGHESRKKAADKARNPVGYHNTNVSLSGANEFANEQSARQSLMSTTPKDSEYLLGYSGDPFGSRRPVSGLVELPENDVGGTGIGDPRRKRSVLHLYNMVLCATGCNPFAYKGYGCYCGFLGSGFVVDGIDSCCKMHDWCYNSAGCPTFLEYFIPYLWKCHRHQPLCAIDHGHYGGPGSCAQRLCECDRQLALCLRRYPCPSTKALCISSPWRLLQNVLML